MALGPFATSGQGTGGRSRKAGVAAGGSANADDKRQKAQFESGKPKMPMGKASMDQAPGGARGVVGTNLPLGKQSGSANEPSGRAGVRGTILPLGRQK